MTFHVGMKVVCVRDGWNILPNHFSGLHLQFPRDGIEYVVRSMLLDYDGGVAIRLHWLIMPPNEDGIEPGFCIIGLDGAANFKPAVENKTDISIFTAMLTPNAKQREREDVRT